MIRARGALIIIVFLGMGLGLGCASKPKQPQIQKTVKPPPAPPAVPAAKNVALDQQFQTAARQEIYSAFESNDPIIRANALEAAQNTLGPAAQDMILRGLGDSEAIVRFAAAMAAGQLRLREAYRPLLGLVNDRSTRVRIGVRFALHRLGDTRFTHDLEKTARDPDRLIRAQTAMVMGMLEEPSALKILRRLYGDPEPIVRIQAAEAMWRLGDEQGLNALATASISQFADDQLISVLAMAAPRDQRVIEHVRGKLAYPESKQGWPEVALAAARAMGQLGSDEGYGVALKGAYSNDARQKALAALAFGAIGRADAQEHLAPMLRHPDPSVRLAAATGMLQLGRSALTQAQ